MKMSSETLNQNSYFYADRLFDSCGHKIGRRRFLLSSTACKCKHLSHGKKKIITYSVSNSDINPADILDLSTIIGPKIYLFHNIDWKKVIFLNEINGIFSEESQFREKNLPSQLLHYPSSLSSLFEYSKDINQNLQLNPHSADDDIDYLYPTRMYPLYGNSYSSTKTDTHSISSLDNKPLVPTAPRLGRPRGGGRKRGYAGRRGTRGNGRRGRCSYQSISTRKLQSEETLSATSGDDDIEPSEEGEMEDAKKFSSKSNYAVSDSLSSLSPSSDDELSNEDEEDVKSSVNEYSDEEGISSPKTSHTSIEKIPKKRVYIDDESSEGAFQHSEEDEEEEGEMSLLRPTRSRNIDRPMYNTSRRARGQYRGRGGRRSLSAAQNLIRIGPASGSLASRP